MNNGALKLLPLLTKKLNVDSILCPTKTILHPFIVKPLKVGGMLLPKQLLLHLKIMEVNKLR